MCNPFAVLANYVYNTTTSSISSRSRSTAKPLHTSQTLLDYNLFAITFSVQQHAAINKSPIASCVSDFVCVFPPSADAFFLVRFLPLLWLFSSLYSRNKLNRCHQMDQFKTRRTIQEVRKEGSKSQEKSCWLVSSSRGTDSQH